MAKFLCLLFPFLLLMGNLSAQEAVTKPSSDRYLKEVISFLNTVKKQELADSSFTLVDAPKYSCLDYTVNDSISFTIEELKQINDEVNSPKISNWKSILPSSIRFLDEKYVNAHSKLIKNPKREIRLFNKYFGGCYHHFSAPIFLRDYTFCLIYVDKICAAGKSTGELQVYEKKEGIWKQLPSRCEWTE